MADPSSDDPPSRLERGSYVADILQGNTTELFWYYVIKRKGSNQIIDLMKFDSRERAIEGAELVLQRLNRTAAAGKS